MQRLDDLVRRIRDLRKSDPVLTPPDEADRAASYPDPYPDGWYKLADADQLKRGQVRYVQAVGQRWALFRSDVDGTLGLMDADCPHQGANLAGGIVKNGCLQCPFHHWRFSVNGQVAELPYSATRPALRARSWPVREYHGLILGWLSSQRRRGEEVTPAYELDEIPEMAGLVFRGALDHPRPVRMHLIEFAENSADFQHFAPLHGHMHVPWTRFQVPLVTVRHQPTWSVDPERPHICYFTNDAVLRFAGRELPSTSARATITFLGPGSVTVFRIELPKLGDIILFHTHLPTAPLSQTVQFRWYANPRIPRLLVSYVVGSWIAQWRNDLAVWENKYYKDRPMLVPGDGPILALRRWFKQFYPAPARAIIG